MQSMTAARGCLSSLYFQHFSVSAGREEHIAAAADGALVKLYILSIMNMFSYQYRVCNVL